MTDEVARHYGTVGSIADRIAAAFRATGKGPETLTTAELQAVDEFHIRGRSATLELAEALEVGQGSRVLDIGSGLGGPARMLAETNGCHVTGIDLTPEFCEVATELSRWVGLSGRVDFRQGDATALPFADQSFDAAMTIHVCMNIARKDLVYAEAKRVLKPGGRFAIYDVLQGEGGAIHYPAPWARDPSISHVATDEQMQTLLAEAGFDILTAWDSSDDSLTWFEALAARQAQGGGPAVSIRTFMGDDFPQMAQNQVRNLKERRIRTVTYICAA